MDTWPVPQMEEICNKASSLSSIMEYWRKTHGMWIAGVFVKNSELLLKG